MVEELIEDCREKEARVEGFGVEYFNGLVKEHNIPAAIADNARVCIKDPNRVFILKVETKDGR